MAAPVSFWSEDRNQTDSRAHQPGQSKDYRNHHIFEDFAPFLPPRPSLFADRAAKFQTRFSLEQIFVDIAALRKRTPIPSGD